MTGELIGRETAIQTVHKTMYQFIDDSETMTDRDNLLLEVNKAICNGLKVIPTENKGDLISRQAVFNIIEREQFKGDAISEIEKLPSAENRGEWIPVSERLPEERQSVLVWCPERRNIYCAYLEKEQWWIFGAYMKVQDEVVAWMPLPSPWKGE